MCLRVVIRNRCADQSLHLALDGRWQTHLFLLTRTHRCHFNQSLEEMHCSQRIKAVILLTIDKNAHTDTPRFICGWLEGPTPCLIQLRIGHGVGVCGVLFCLVLSGGVSLCYFCSMPFEYSHGLNYPLDMEHGYFFFFFYPYWVLFIRVVVVWCSILGIVYTCM